MNWMKKAVASALAAGMLAGFLPAVSFAETTHNIEQEGVSLGAGDCTGGMLQIAKAVYQGAQAGTSIVAEIRKKK